MKIIHDASSRANQEYGVISDSLLQHLLTNETLAARMAPITFARGGILEFSKTLSQKHPMKESILLLIRPTKVTKLVILVR